MSLLTKLTSFDIMHTHTYHRQYLLFRPVNQTSTVSVYHHLSCISVICCSATFQMTKIQFPCCSLSCSYCLHKKHINNIIIPKYVFIYSPCNSFITAILCRSNHLRFAACHILCSNMAQQRLLLLVLR